MSLVIDISVSRVDYLLTVQARRTEDRTPDRDVYTYQVSISRPIAGTRIAAPPTPPRRADLNHPLKGTPHD